MTKVKFYVEKDGTILAYFPNEIADQLQNRMCYARVGQHSACSPTYIKHLKYATPQQYAPLLEELKSVGYNDLEIVGKRQRKKQFR